MQRIGLIGCGNLGSALVGGLSDKILIYERQAGAISDHVLKAGHKLSSSINELVAASEIIIIAVKLKDIPQVLVELNQSALNEKQLLISVAAGVTSQAIYAGLKAKPRIARAMPNLASVIKAGVSGVWAADKNDLKILSDIFSVLGKIVSVNQEADLDIVTGLSGSGPAFVFVMLSGMIQGGIAQGLSKEQAELLAVETLKGAAAVFEHEQLSLEQLIARVASPGGTTLAGLKVLEEKEVMNSYKEAVLKATARASEIGQESLAKLAAK